MSNGPRLTTSTKQNRRGEDCSTTPARTELTTNRRYLLSGLASGFALLAGCSGLISDDSTDTQQPSSTAEASTATSSSTETTSTSTQTETRTQSTNAQLTTYTSTKYGFRIQHPTEWSIHESIPNRVMFTSNATDSVVQVMLLDTIGQQFTLSQVVDRTVSSIRSEMIDVEILAERDTTLSSGQSAHVFEFRYDNPNDPVGKIRKTHLVTLHEGVTYVVEFGYLSSNYPETTEKLAATFIDSFAITGQPSIDQPTPKQTTDESSNDAFTLPLR